MDFNVDSIKNEINDREFDEYPACSICGSIKSNEKLIASDGNRIVECPTCKLWFTSPRLNEDKWEYYIRSESVKRNKKFTENRIKYGVALSKNISNQPPDWRKRKRNAHNRIFRLIKKWSSIPITRIHEVGCGVGFFLDDMRRKGISVSGNDLNGYACKIMRERFDLNVHTGNFVEANLPKNSVDVVMMSDYIEHTYHPFEDMCEAYRVLVPEGMLYIHTFIIDSDPFNTKKGRWNMLWWNHVYHFSTQSLVRMAEHAGFIICMVIPNLKKGMIQLIAKKR